MKFNVIPTEKQAMRQYKDWYIAHQQCNFDGDGLYGKERQRYYLQFISNRKKCFIAKYNLLSINFKNLPRRK